MLPLPPALSSMPNKPPSFCWFCIAVIVSAIQFEVALVLKSDEYEMPTVAEPITDVIRVYPYRVKAYGMTVKKV